MRLFLAINFPGALREAMHAAAAPLREAAPALGWTAAERLHLTVKFLGEQPDSIVEPLARGVSEAAARFAAVAISLGRPGAFPNFRRPRVVWMGVEDEGKLELLHHDVEVACQALGLEPEGRPFRPHVTLGRVRGAPAPGIGRALAAAARGVRLRAEAAVDSVDIMRSEPGPGGSRYTRLAAAPLRRA
ncbi:MAG TPA: RNA 2',3'-cyclic phosphodiesterase [Gemmatimonadaceae bacterium]|nr:RNA 2',3'-cyclic phosphodiesterase [Gemmatimonadaceae bacterium]